MISKQELQYVGDFARKVPYPGDDYARRVIDNLADALSLFKKKYYGKRYSLILSNGEEICFEIKEKNLAHLLGIDFRNISTYMKPLLYSILGFEEYETFTSFGVLTRIVDNGDMVIKNDADNYDKFLNYYKVMVKTSCFDKLSEFNEFNFGCINFDKSIYESLTGNKFLPDATKYIFSQNDEALIPYCMMGLKSDNGSEVFIPETFLAPTNFSDYLHNQELLLPIQLLINDDQNLVKLMATPEEKIRMLNLYKSLIQIYNTGSYINIFNDYETILRDSVAKKKTK